MTEIIEHDGRKFVKQDDAEAYIKECISEYRTLQDEVEGALSELKEIAETEAIEERRGKAKALVASMNGVDYDEVESLFSFESEEAFETSYDYFQGLKQSEYGDHAAGFEGTPKKPQGNGAKERYEYGQEMYKSVRGGA